MKPGIVVLCAALVVAVPLLAREKSDVIIMKNGDRITCEIKSLASDTLYISIDYILGTSSVEWIKVDHVESKQLFIVKTQDGIVYSGTLSTPVSSGERPIKIQILEPSDSKIEVDKSQIIKMDQTSSTIWQRFNGDIGLGVIYSKGNQSTQYNFNSDVNYPRERWSASAAYNSTLSSSTGRSPATRNEINLNIERLLRWNNWYYTGLADFLQSSEQGIQLQSGIGGGFGRYLVNDNRSTVTLFGGLVWQRISYQQMIVPSLTQNAASALIGSDVRLFRFNKTNLSVSATLLPSITESGRVHFNLNTSYYVKLWSNLTWNISFYGNWDNRPPPTFSGSDYGTSSGVAWKFGNR
ncbi:MAG TPA: DUF481 domain-containing protein [Candidatus Acidoferrum sp.]|nr:DUF481 domain-containing protein [Candidatus Acidoferrum sp.]